MRPNGTAQSGPPTEVITTSADLGRVARCSEGGKSYRSCYGSLYPCSIKAYFCLFGIQQSIYPPRGSCPQTDFASLSAHLSFFFLLFFSWPGLIISILVSKLERLHSTALFPFDSLPWWILNPKERELLLVDEWILLNEAVRYSKNKWSRSAGSCRTESFIDYMLAKVCTFLLLMLYFVMADR